MRRILQMISLFFFISGCSTSTDKIYSEFAIIESNDNILLGLPKETGMIGDTLAMLNGIDEVLFLNIRGQNFVKKISLAQIDTQLIYSSIIGYFKEDSFSKYSDIRIMKLFTNGIKIKQVINERNGITLLIGLSMPLKKNINGQPGRRWRQYNICCKVGRSLNFENYKIMERLKNSNVAINYNSSICRDGKSYFTPLFIRGNLNDSFSYAEFTMRNDILKFDSLISVSGTLYHEVIPNQVWCTELLSANDTFYSKSVNSDQYRGQILSKIMSINKVDLASSASDFNKTDTFYNLLSGNRNLTFIKSNKSCTPPILMNSLQFCEIEKKDEIFILRIYTP